MTLFQFNYKFRMKLIFFLIKQGRKRPLDTQERKIERKRERERERERERRRVKERGIEKERESVNSRCFFIQFNELV